MQFRHLPLLYLTCALAGLPSFASAATFVNAYNNITANNLQIIPSAGGSLEFSSDPQFINLLVSSLGQNSLGEYNPETNQANAFTNLSVNSAVTWGTGHGEVNYAQASVAANSSIDIPPHQKMSWAYGQGNANRGQWFEITGGTGDTSTFLSLEYSGSLYGSAGDASYFNTQIIADLELWDANGIQLTQQVGNKVILGGPNQTLSLAVPVTSLSDTITLSYNTWYWIYYEADSETYGIVPEPDTLFLMISGLALLARRHVSRQSKHCHLPRALLIKIKV